MKHLKRLRLFVRDWTSEWGIAWSIARYRDCDRNGGHRWDTNGPTYGKVFITNLPWQRTCTRCGCSETVHPTWGTANSNAANFYAMTRY
jgi:hypothetical protein